MPGKAMVPIGLLVVVSILRTALSSPAAAYSVLPSAVRARPMASPPPWTWRATTVRVARSMTARSWLLSYTTQAQRPSGWNTTRLGLPRPTAMVATTSKVLVSMTETESDLVLVTNSVAAPAGLPASRSSASASRLGNDLTTGLLLAPSGRRLVDRGDRQVGRRPPQRESYRVSGLDRLQNLGRRGPEAHRHGRHVAGDLAVRDDDDPDVGEAGPHDAGGVELALATGGGRRRPRQLQLTVESPR